MTLMIERLHEINASRIPIWIDSKDYCLHLLNKGEPLPWRDSAELVAFLRQQQSLTQSDVIALPVYDFFQYWLRKNPGLQVQMGEKRRLGFALKTLLASPEARQHLYELVCAVTDSFTQTSVVLEIPCFKKWMGEMHCLAKQKESVDVTWDDAESAAMYVADFLRVFADANVSGFLIAGGGIQEISSIQQSVLQPCLNVAEHYRWGCFLKGYVLENSNVPVGSLTPQPLSADSISNPTSVLQNIRFLYLIVPKEANPENVQELLSIAQQEREEALA